ncbi:MAG: hypothetical protein PHP36_00800 [Atribacterota bacterium]|nr:hypothetical protein [Atribacterota bacterium]
MAKRWKNFFTYNCGKQEKDLANLSPVFLQKTFEFVLPLFKQLHSVTAVKQ